MFFRVFQHLLPRAQAWSLTKNKVLSQLFTGLANFLDDTTGPRTYADLVLLDAFPATARLPALTEWEKQFGIEPNPVEATRRQALAAAWAAGGGQSPAYIQGVLQTAGFNVYIHEWWIPGGVGGIPYVPRDPRSYTNVPSIGTWQCTPSSLRSVQPQCAARDMPGQPQCNDLLGNDPGYLVNKDLTARPPPIVPSDPNTWPFFLYIGAATFPNRATVPVTRRAELERLILKLRPSQNWVVMLVNYSSDVLTNDVGQQLTNDSAQGLFVG